MGAVKRHLEDKRDAVLDEVRLFGASVLVERTTSSPAAWETTLRNALQVAHEWIAGPTDQEWETLSDMRHDIDEWKSGAPTDLLADYRDMLETMVEEFVSELNEGWLEPYDLTAWWNQGALIITKTEDAYR